MRVSPVKHQETDCESLLRKKQITDYIIKRLKVKPMSEKAILTEVYSYYNEIVPVSVIIELKKRGLVIKEGRWSIL